MPLVLVPINVFEVQYYVAEGIPYSQFDTLVLKAVGEGATSQEQLEEIFKIHPRLLIQSLITLIDAGWIALSNAPSQQFIVTASGRSCLTLASNEHTELPSSTQLFRWKTRVAMEGVTGALVLERNIHSTTKRQLEAEKQWNERLCLEQEIYRVHLAASDVHYLLPIGKNRRLHSIESANLITRNDSYMLVDFDLDRRIALNIPERLKVFGLLERVTEKAIQIQNDRELDAVSQWMREEFSYELSQNAAQIINENITNLLWTPTDEVLGATQFEANLQNALQSAYTILCMTLNNNSPERLEQIKESVRQAIERGVDIHILRGVGNTEATKKILKQWRYEFSRTIRSQCIEFNDTIIATESPFLMYDEPEGVYHAIVGNFSWLSTTTTMQGYIGFHIQHPTLLRNLALGLVSLWNSTRENLSSFPDRWMRIADQLYGSAIANSPDGDSQIQLLFGVQHETLRRYIQNSSMFSNSFIYNQTSVCLTSYKWQNPISDNIYALGILIQGKGAARLIDIMNG